MRVLICGDRNWHKPIPIDVIVGGLANVYGPGRVTVIEGQARGADLLAASAAERHGTGHEPFPAKWDELGKRAGPIRNQQMLDDGKPDVVFAFHDDIAASKGTRDMCERARKAGLPVYVVSRYKP